MGNKYYGEIKAMNQNYHSEEFGAAGNEAEADPQQFDVLFRGRMNFK